MVLALSVGESGIIDCSSTSFPPLINTTLSRGDDMIALDADNTSTISSATTQDAAEYTCTAMNEIGTTTLVVDVQVGSAPGIVSNIELNEEEDGSKVTITWDAADDNGVDITSYTIVIEYQEKTITGMVTPPNLSFTVRRDDLDIPKEGREVLLKITITAVNEIGEGEPASHDTTAKFGAISSSSLSMLPQTMLSIVLITFITFAMMY